MQFSPNKHSQITEVFPQFSPLSTPLIIRAKGIKKEKLLIERRG
jgi:hypothetical protein